jgi:hypothetical protein
MEYLVGSVATMLGIFLIMRAAQKDQSRANSGAYRVKYNQSHVYRILRPYTIISSMMMDQEKRVTQASEHEKSLYVRVMVVDGKAYWIKDNTFFTADMVDDNLDNSSTKTVDTMGMDDVQLKKMMFIVEKLTDGRQDDRGNSGYSWI